jgi:hypothetical protein
VLLGNFGWGQHLGSPKLQCLFCTRLLFYTTTCIPGSRPPYRRYFAHGAHSKAQIDRRHAD